MILLSVLALLLALSAPWLGTDSRPFFDGRPERARFGTLC
jgi:hypothetical protein